MSEAVIDSTENTPDRPTFDTVSWEDAPSASDPASTSTTPQAAATPETPTAVTSHPETDDRSPFIPRARFDEVISERAALKQWREQRQWAENVDPQAFETIRNWYARAHADQRGFALGTLDELLAHPEHGPAMRSELARRLGTRQQNADATGNDLPQPDVEITDGNGNVVGRTYSDKQLTKRDEFLTRQVMSQVDAKYAPHVKTLDEIREAREQHARQAQADDFGRSFASELAKMPLFDEVKADVAKALAGMSLPDQPEAIRAATLQAYINIVGPKLQNNAQLSTVADFQRKAHASTAVNPSAAALTTPKRPKSFHELGPDAWD